LLKEALITSDQIYLDLPSFNEKDINNILFKLDEIIRTESIFIEINLVSSNKHKSLDLNKYRTLSASNIKYISQADFELSVKSVLSYYNIVLISAVNLAEKYQNFYAIKTKYIKEKLYIFSYLNGSFLHLKTFEPTNIEFKGRVFDYKYKDKVKEVKFSGEPFSDELVYLKGKKIKLSNKLSSGAEGSIYLDKSNNLALKVFDKRKPNDMLLNKLEKMLSINLFNDFTAWPIALLKSKNDEVIGYASTYFDGLNLDILMKQDYIKTNFKTISEIVNFSIKLLFNLVKSLKTLHQHNVLLSDVNAKNIMFDGNANIFLVDCLSFQIENYPSQIATKVYEPPELNNLNKYRRQFYLKSFGNESYSIGLLIMRLISKLSLEIKQYPNYVEDAKIWIMLNNKFGEEYKNINAIRPSTEFYYKFFEYYYNKLNQRTGDA
jgi:hypothetical protein